MAKKEKRNFDRDYPTTFTQIYNLVVDLYGLIVVNGELKPVYEPREVHKEFMRINKDEIIERLLENAREDNRLN